VLLHGEDEPDDARPKSQLRDAQVIPAGRPSTAIPLKFARDSATRAALNISYGSDAEMLTTSKCFPVYPELRTSASMSGMSQLCCHHQTHALQQSVERPFRPLAKLL
jgi:hypothetical protein